MEFIERRIELCPRVWRLLGLRSTAFTYPTSLADLIFPLFLALTHAQLVYKEGALRIFHMLLEFPRFLPPHCNNPDRLEISVCLHPVISHSLLALSRPQRTF